MNRAALLPDPRIMSLQRFEKAGIAVADNHLQTLSAKTTVLEI